MARVEGSPTDLIATRPCSGGAPADYGTMGHMQLLNAAAAEEFYRSECQRNGVSPNNSFSRQLLGCATVFDFDNGYLGERGIVPILSTLQHLAVVELSMRSCELSVNDITLLYSTFGKHKTLKRIDLRGVTIPVASARRLLALALENTSITEILIDQSTPKYLSIQRQCFANAGATILAARCLVCARPVIHTPDQRVEGRLLLALGDGFEVSAASLPNTSGIQLLVMFRCILACCEANNGVLFLCSSECREQVTADITASMRAVVSELSSANKSAQPKNAILRRAVTDTLRIIAKSGLGATCAGLHASTFDTQLSATGIRDKKGSGYNRTYDSTPGMDTYEGDGEDYDDSSSTTRTDLSREEDLRDHCTVCGAPGACLPDSALAAMQHICRDIQRSPHGTLHPSALLRLTRLMVQYAAGLRACTVNCVKHLVRFGLYGYGGVTLARTVSADPPVTDLGLAPEKLPSEDFAIVNFAALCVDEQDEEDITCALTVASAMTDIEGVPIDPYMIFAVARHLAKMPSCALGVGLRYACEAVRLIGCLPVSISPFNRRREKPARASYINWSEWDAVADVHTIVRAAFSRRRAKVYVVEGPHGNVFDNIRTVLWTFREQRRAVLVAMRFCIEWLSVPGGVLPNEMAPHCAFLTTLKVVGQSDINNSHHLICQSNFGPRAGNRGLFYIPRGLFNLHITGPAYIFIDGSTLWTHRGVPVALYAERILPPRVLRLAGETALLQELFYRYSDALSWQRRTQLESTRIACDFIRRMPPALFFTYRSANHTPSDAQVLFLEEMRRAIFAPGTRSLRLFLLRELLGPSTALFIAWALRHLSSLPPQRLEQQCGAVGLSPQQHSQQQWRRISRLQWNPLESGRKTMSEQIPTAGNSNSNNNNNNNSGNVQRRNILKSSPLRKEPRQVRAGSPRRSLRKQQTPQQQQQQQRGQRQTGGAKDTRDAMRLRLEYLWSAAREERALKRRSEERPVSSLHRRSLIGAKAMARSSGGGGGGESIPFALMDQPWRAVRLCTDTGALADEALFFIGDHMCCFNVVNRTVVTPLCSVLGAMGAMEFPFAAGFDCAMNAPTNPRVAYFFCGEYWFEWDTYRQTCTGGPFRLRLHQQFAALPAAFHRGVDAVVAVPNTTCAIFFAQLQYVVFDCANRKTVGPLRRIDARDGHSNKIMSSGSNNNENSNNVESGNVKNSDDSEKPVIFSNELAALFPLGPMATLAMPPDDDNDGDEAGNDMQCKTNPTESERSANKNRGAVMLIGYDGQTAIVHSFRASAVPTGDPLTMATTTTTTTTTATAMHDPQPLPLTSLARLPIAFRQMTTAALPIVCAAVLSRECAVRGCHIADADADVAATVFVDSTHTRADSPLGDHAPVVSLTLRGLITQSAAECGEENDNNDTVAAAATASAALLALSRCSRPPLLRDEVVLSATHDETSAPALVTTDFGDAVAASFGALVVVLDTTRVDARLLRAAPLEAVVESSADGVAFVRHARMTLAARATAACWGEAPAARVWRLRFLSPLPRGIGIVRMLWRSVACVAPRRLLDPTAPLCPNIARTADVRIAAPRVLAEPRRLVDALAPGAVFASRTSAAGWRVRHCALPILPCGACLFFSGDAFVELDAGKAQGEAYSNTYSYSYGPEGSGSGAEGWKDKGPGRAVALAGHPAFAALPQPFAQGIDAAFYPIPDTANIVALLHGGMLLRWNLDTGRPESDPVEAHTTCFRGMPWPMDEVETIVQLWDRPGEVLVVRSSQAVRWSVTREVLLEGPLPLRNFPQLYHEAFSGKPILCATALPHEPCRYYVFCEDRVVVNIVNNNAGGECISTTVPAPVRHFDQFSALSWFLAWGELRYDCVVRLNFPEEQPLFAGLVMRSSEPGDTVEEWLVEYSDDGVEWNCVGRHRQCAASSRTMWGLASVAHRAHQLWRLTLIYSNIVIVNKSNNNGDRKGPRGGFAGSSGSRTHEQQSLLYTHLSFLTLEAMPYRLSPRNIAFTGTLSAPASELFIDDAVTIAFERSLVSNESPSARERVNTPPYLDHNSSNTSTMNIPHHITIDYGEQAPELMAFECHCIAGSVRDVWSVWCSDDGEEWEHCGTWRSWSQKFKTSWAPRGPRQYWRVELYSNLPNVVYNKLCLFEYVGPSVTVERTPVLSEGDGWDTSLLWAKNSPGCNISPLAISAHPGNAIVLDTKVHPVPIVGVHLLSNENQRTSTKFAVDYSEDGVVWRSIDEAFLLNGGEVYAGWKNVDFHRFWRLRIVQHVGPASLLLRDVRFETAQPALYHSIQDNDPTGLELKLTDGPEEIVAVQTKLPPGSQFDVEKLSLDGITWETVGTIRNDDARRTRAVRQGWIPQGSSSKWRLRPVPVLEDTETFSTEPSNPSMHLSQAQPHVCSPLQQPPVVMEAPVEWLVFAGLAVMPVDFTDSPLLDVTATGFDEPQAARRLTETTQAVVLRSTCEVTTASIAWSFSDDLAPRFYQVSFRGRTVVNPNVPPVPETPISPPKVQEKIVSVTPPNGSKMRRREKIEVVEEKVVVEVPIVKPMSIIVEISGNGIDYVPVATRPFAQLCNALTWKSRLTASHWRIRFINIPTTDFLELWRVTWMIGIGVPTFVKPRVSCPLSNSMQETWLQESFNNEEEFCQMCREGYDQSRSVVSGLREPQDIERHGKVAQHVSNLRAKFSTFVARTSKGAAKDQDPPLDKFVSVGRPLSNDIMYLLYRAAKHYSCNVDELNELIAHPMLFGQDVSRPKEGLSWFYPKFEQCGVLVESFYGFQKVWASFSVRWSLSFALQSNVDHLKDSSIHPLSPHLASILVTVKVDQDNWIASEHFPGLPLLYHSGFTEKPMVIVFAQNQITFTSKYNLTIPGGNPFPALHPFRLFPGVNFIQRMSLSGCPCPIYDRLQLIYKPEFLGKYETEVVYTSISMNSNAAAVRFTLPGEGINFGLNGLHVGSIEFEVVFVDDSVPISPKPTIQTNVDPIASLFTAVQRMTLVTHDATYTPPYDGADATPISISGYVSDTSDKISMHGISPSAHMPLKGNFGDAFITDVQLSFELEAGEAPQTFLDPVLLVKGFLTTPQNGTYSCCIQSTRPTQNFNSFNLQVPMIQLAEFIRLGDYLVPAQSKPRDLTDWTHEAPIFVSAELQMHPSKLDFCGHGFIEFAGFRGEAYVAMTAGGTRITASLPVLVIGGVTLQSLKPDEPVTIDIFAPSAAPCVVRIDGYSRLLAPHPYPTRVELSNVGVMCVSSGPFYDICIEEDALFPSGAYAQVSVLEQPIIDELTELLQRTPLIASLLANGMTFSFHVREVVAEPCVLDRQLLVLNVRGVLFGCYFDVLTTLVRPDNTLAEAKRICHNILPYIIEQCDEPLWASYEMFVGLVSNQKPASASPNGQSSSENASKADVEAEVEENQWLMDGSKERDTNEGIVPVLGWHHVRVPERHFLDRWFVRECEAMDKEMDKEF